MKKLITCLAAGLMVLGTQSLKADSTSDSSTSSSTAPATGEKHKKMSAEERQKREELMKAIGLTRADLKGLSPEDRQAKIKEAAEKKATELKAKKTAGTLTDEEKTQLAEIEKFLAHGHHKKAAASQ